jgi:5-methylcytosine-specific restriction endonuclease McrA
VKLFFVLVALYLNTYAQYSRAEWITSWKDADRDCQDTRQEVLIRESLVTPTMDEKGCKVLKGLWVCFYSGKLVTDPSLLEIDHVVPLKNVYLSGGSTFTPEDKHEYAQDLETPEVLIAVTVSVNRSKGDKSPDQWMPPFIGYHCDYLSRWLSVKETWGLSMTSAESTFVYNSIAKCP